MASVADHQSHEWLHQLEAFYKDKGIKLPRGGLHGNDNYGFKHQNGWKHWYKAFINAELKEGDGTRVGLGEAAWRFGTIRDEMACRLPDYLTPERRRANLLVDGSFEQAPTGNWSSRSWLKNSDVASVVAGVNKSGKSAAVLRSSDKDDAMFCQKVAVKPNTRYLLSGWVKASGVAVAEKDGKMGANLSVWGGFESSRSLIGTCDWTYAAVVFNSGSREAVEVGARLGHNGSTATGTAWFDDLVLVKLPDSAQVQ